EPRRSQAGQRVRRFAPRPGHPVRRGTPPSQFSFIGTRLSRAAPASGTLSAVKVGEPSLAAGADDVLAPLPLVEYDATVTLLLHPVGDCDKNPAGWFRFSPAGAGPIMTVRG